MEVLDAGHDCSGLVAADPPVCAHQVIHTHQRNPISTRDDGPTEDSCLEAREQYLAQVLVRVILSV